MIQKCFVMCIGLGLVGFGVVGCGTSDPVESSTGEYTVAPEATLDPQGATEAQAERERKQAEADQAAGRRGT